MENNKNLNSEERLKGYNKALEIWDKRRLLDENSISFDEVCADLIITNSINNYANEPVSARIFNSQESINIGLILIPNQFDETNTQEEFINNFKRFRNQFDTILFINNDSNFTDLGFKEIVPNDRTTTKTHYRNTCFDFESLKDVFKSKSMVIMKTAIASGSNGAMEAIVSTFEFPDFYRNQIVEIENTIVCVASGNHDYTNEELNSIGKYSLDQMKRGAILVLATLEDMSLLNEVRVSVFISVFDSAKP